MLTLDKMLPCLSVVLTADASMNSAFRWYLDDGKLAFAFHEISRESHWMDGRVE